VVVESAALTSSSRRWVVVKVVRAAEVVAGKLRLVISF
jgi:hypothetical protein